MDKIKMLKTAKGQIDGIIKMIDEKRDCFDVSNQILACVSILKKVNVDVLSSQLYSCTKEEQENEKFEKIISIIKKIGK